MNVKRFKKIYLFIMFLLIIVSIINNVVNFKYKDIINATILIIFAVDSFYSLYKTDNKKDYLKHHFLDFIAIIPFHSGFRMVKFFPVIMQSIQITSIGQKYFLPVVLKLRETGTGKLFNIFLVIFIFLPLPLIWIEPNINNYEDLIWWEMQTVTTVGYGDIVIQTGFGRFIGGVLMVLGVGIISTFTSSLTHVLSHPKKTAHKKQEILLEEILKEKNFDSDDLDIIEAWVKLERKKQDKK